MRRPLGITIVAILALINGLLGLCCPVIFFLFGSIFTAIGGFFIITLGIIGILAGIFLVVGPLIQLIFAYGAFKLRTWAWWLGLVGTGISLLGAVLNIIGGADIAPTLGSAILPLIIFIYLLTPGVRQAFRL